MIHAAVVPQSNMLLLTCDQSSMLKSKTTPAALQTAQSDKPTPAPRQLTASSSTPAAACSPLVCCWCCVLHSAAATGEASASESCSCWREHCSPSHAAALGAGWAGRRLCCLQAGAAATGGKHQKEATAHLLFGHMHERWQQARLARATTPHQACILSTQGCRQRRVVERVAAEG